MRYKCLGLLTVSFVLPGFILSHPAFAQSDELNSRAVLPQEEAGGAVTFGNDFVQLNARSKSGEPRRK